MCNYVTILNIWFNLFLLNQPPYNLLTDNQNMLNILINTFDGVQLFPPVAQRWNHLEWKSWLSKGVLHPHNFSLEARLPVCLFASLRASARKGLKSEHMGEDNKFVNKWEPSQIPWNFIMPLHIKVPPGDSGGKLLTHYHA